MNETTLDPAEVSEYLNVSTSAGEVDTREVDASDTEPAQLLRSGRACTLFAVVDANGRLVRGCGAVRARKVDLPVGAYEVIFDRKVCDCAYVATIGLPGNRGASTSGEITVVGRFNNESGVFLTTHNRAGQLADRGFHLAVHCCC